MVLLKAYRCHNCLLICDTSDDYFVGICVECGKLTCGPCRTLCGRADAKSETATCTVTQKNCEYTSVYTSFINILHKFPPDDELKLLNFGKWCPVWCVDKCTSSFARERIDCVNTTTLRCRNCRPADIITKNHPINTYMKIIDELRDYFSDEAYIVTDKRGVHLESFHCQSCLGKLHYPFNLSDAGALLCKNCKETSLSTCYSVNKDNLKLFYSLLRYTPDKDDLKLLTYSKWSPLRCELCSTLFSTNFLQLPMFHPGCSKLMCNQCVGKHSCSEKMVTSILLKWVLDVDKEFRAFFKNGGNGPSDTPSRKHDVDKRPNNQLLLPSSYDLDSRSDMPGIAEKIRCESCTGLNAPSNIRMCSDCEKSCLCLTCLTEEHWGHHIEKIVPAFQTAFIQKESEKTLENLAKWRGSVTEGNKQIDAASMKVVDNYKLLYTKAIRDSDLALLQAIKERGNLRQVQKIIDEFTDVQVKLRSNVEDLEKSLSDILKITKEQLYDGTTFPKKIVLPQAREEYSWKVFNVESVTESSLIRFTYTGDLLCAKCKDAPAAFFSVTKVNLSFLGSVLGYIPDKDDLKLLTYSKWTPLRCELCSTLFATNFFQFPIFHPSCCKLICNQCAFKHTCSRPNSTAVQLKWVLDVDKELRSFFKDGGVDSPETPFQKPEVEEKPNNPLCLPSSYDLGSLSSAVSGIPEKISCGSCSQLNAPTNVRMCADCKKSCLCFARFIKEHWSHHIEEISTTLQTAVIQKESENTLEKLAKWKGSVTECYRQIDAVNVKVVDNYSWLYTRAIRESDLAILQEIRERGNIGQLQKVIDEFTSVQVKLRSNVGELEKTLSDIIKVTKERHGEEETVEEDF